MIGRSESETIVRSIVGLAHSLGLRVTAEGIEDAEQLSALTKLGCEYVQGYHFSRPLPPGEIEAMLADRRELGSL
jgi:EAL domain-containing protein (putative c-di-GMP-specific phosphodiesterase class I)